uniref:Uncharacterized protein n=1 Tax=Clytia hemisphaerica TaxID=252671 RepID=A0A7M5X9B2_9CNID
MAESESQEASTQQLTQQLQNAISDLSTLKRDTQDALNQFKDHQKTSIEKFNKKLERKRKIDQVFFNKPGNEEQYKHAKQVLESMENVEEAITENRLEDAKKALEEERYWEIEENEQASVAGKIQKFAKFWESELDAPPFILDIVKTGYSLPFITTPPPAYSRNNKSSKREHIFTEKSIKELLKNNCIQEVDYIPHCVNPLSVAERNNKLRLVLDLRNVNKYIQVNKF